MSAPSYDELKARVAELEAEKENRAFFEVRNWADAIKLASLPMAIVLGVYTAYDKIYLRMTNQDPATLAAVRNNIDGLQALNAQAYRLRAKGEDLDASAFEAANLAKRERMAGEAFAHYVKRPAYLTPTEKQMLANELLVQGRTRDAAVLVDDLKDEMRTPRQEAELALFEGRVYGADGDAFDLDKARDALRSVGDRAAAIPRESDKTGVLISTLYYRAYLELRNDGDCAVIAPMMGMLDEYFTEFPEEEAAQIFQADGEKLAVIFDARCN